MSPIRVGVPLPGVFVWPKRVFLSTADNQLLRQLQERVTTIEAEVKRLRRYDMVLTWSAPPRARPQPHFLRFKFDCLAVEPKPDSDSPAFLKRIEVDEDTRIAITCLDDQGLDRVLKAAALGDNDNPAHTVFRTKDLQESQHLWRWLISAYNFDEPSKQIVSNFLSL
jgi:hypothetical protein